MKIFYVGDKYDYMRPDRGFSYGYYNFYQSLVAMDGGRHSVVFFPTDEIIQREGKEKTNTRLAEEVEKEKPRIMFFAVSGEIGDILDQETVRAISSQKEMTTVAWMSDDQWAFEAYSRHWAPYFNWVITTDHKALAKYRKMGYENVILSQWGVNNSVYQKRPLPKIYDVSFVGSAHGNRGEMVKKIQEQGIQVYCWGSGWPNGRVSQEKMVEVFSQSNICLNFTKNSGILWKELAYLFLRRRMIDGKLVLNDSGRIGDNVKSFRSALWNNQIKGRNFEIPGCGSFCLAEYVEGIERYYERGKEIDCFSTPQEAAEKIRYYLAHEEEREAMAKAAYERTLREHTYEKRFQEIFKRMGLAEQTI